MRAQQRSPVRKPVNESPVNYSQPHRKPVVRQEDGPIEAQVARMRVEDDDDGDDWGYAGASAERSPGRISGRNRDTAMFDPMGKRGTYVPYGGFDSIIDEYYTEGDPAAISVPAPSQLQKREQSRSPQRDPNIASFIQQARPFSVESGRASHPPEALTRPEMPRNVSGTSTHSSNTASGRGISPIRSNMTHGGRPASQDDSQDQSGRPKKEVYYKPNVYYDIPGFGANPSGVPYPDGSPVRNAAPNPSGGARRYEDREPQATAIEQSSRGRYDDQYNAPSNVPPRTQRGPPPRGQRSMEFGNPLRQPGSQSYHTGSGSEPRRRDMTGRDPRAVQQDPRLAPRQPMSQDPRARQAQPRQQMRPSDGQYAVGEERAMMRGPPHEYEDRSYDGRQQPRAQRRARDDHQPPYPAGSTDGYDQRKQPNEQPPLERYRSPQEYRGQDPRMQQEQQRPSPGFSRNDRGPSPVQGPAQPQMPVTGPRNHTPPIQRGPPHLQQQGQIRPSGYQQQPQLQPQQQQPQQQPQQQQLQQQQQQQQLQQQQQQQHVAQRPVPLGAAPNRSNDKSDMVMHVEPAGIVTVAELNSLRKEASKSNSPQIQLALVKRLIEASTVLATDGGKADPKQAKKNHDDYCREALRTLKQITSLDKPFPEALFFLANCYGNGALSLEVDHERAFALYEQAAKLQHPASAYRTAVCLEIGAGTRQDVERAVRFYRRAAEYGDPAAMYKIGMIMLRGLLQEQVDPKTALIWLQKAAEKADVDNPHALHELALLYEKGDQGAGIPLDEGHAKDLFTRAAKLHYAPSQFRLGYAYEYGTLGCPVDPRRSIAWFSRGAERGDPESELSLSGWYLTGSEGILAQNDREAYLWGRKAAEKGLAKAEFAVGYFFESGIGTNADLDEAVKWYKRAATAGQKKAQERLLALAKRKR